MKNLFIAFVFILAALTSCKKNNPIDGDEKKNADNFKIADYIIAGETFWGNNVNNCPPYIMTFSDDGNMTIHTLTDNYVNTYQVNGNRITITDVGYIDIEDGKLTFLLAGANVKNGTLIKKADAASFVGKSFPKGQRMVWKADGSSAPANVKDYYVQFDNTTVTEFFSIFTLPGNPYVPVSTKKAYAGVSNVAGYGTDQKLLFYVNPSNGRLVYWTFSPGTYTYYKY